jgi:hypothetical protein
MIESGNIDEFTSLKNLIRRIEELLQDYELFLCLCKKYTKKLYDNNIGDMILENMGLVAQELLECFKRGSYAGVGEYWKSGLRVVMGLASVALKGDGREVYVNLNEVKYVVSQTWDMMKLVYAKQQEITSNKMTFHRRTRSENNGNDSVISRSSHQKPKELNSSAITKKRKSPRPKSVNQTPNINSDLNSTDSSSEHPHDDSKSQVPPVKILSARPPPRIGGSTPNLLQQPVHSPNVYHHQRNSSEPSYQNLSDFINPPRAGGYPNNSNRRLPIPPSESETRAVHKDDPSQRPLQNPSQVLLNKSSEKIFTTIPVDNIPQSNIQRSGSHNIHNTRSQLPPSPRASNEESNYRLRLSGPRLYNSTRGIGLHDPPKPPPPPPVETKSKLKSIQPHKVLSVSKVKNGVYIPMVPLPIKRNDLEEKDIDEDTDEEDDMLDIKNSARDSPTRKDKKHATSLEQIKFRTSLKSPRKKDKDKIKNKEKKEKKEPGVPLSPKSGRFGVIFGKKKRRNTHSFNTKSEVRSSSSFFML